MSKNLYYPNHNKQSLIKEKFSLNESSHNYNLTKPRDYDSSEDK